MPTALRSLTSRSCCIPNGYLPHPMRSLKREAPEATRASGAPAESLSSLPLRGLALEVGDLVGLGVGLLLRAPELVLGVALALLLLALAAQPGVVRQVTCSLLCTSGHLVHDSHWILLG